MKYVVLSVLSIVALGCGQSNVNSVTTKVPAVPSGPNTVTYTLQASISEPGDVQSNSTATQSVYATASMLAPNQLTSLANQSECTRATLTIGACQVYYMQQPNTGVYTLFDGTCDYTKAISVPMNSSITLSIQTGYATQFTSAQVVVTVTKQ